MYLDRLFWEADLDGGVLVAVDTHPLPIIEYGMTGSEHDLGLGWTIALLGIAELTCLDYLASRGAPSAPRPCWSACCSSLSRSIARGSGRPKREVDGNAMTIATQ